MRDKKQLENPSLYGSQEIPNKETVGKDNTRNCDEDVLWGDPQGVQWRRSNGKGRSFSWLEKKHMNWCEKKVEEWGHKSVKFTEQYLQGTLPTKRVRKDPHEFWKIEENE